MAYSVFLTLLGLFVVWVVSQNGVWRMLTPVQRESFQPETIRLAPLSAIGKAWFLAVRLPWTRPRLCAALLAVFSVPPALDYLTGRVLTLGPNRLLALAISWLVLEAALLAIAAIRLHRHAAGGFDETPSRWLSTMAALTGMIIFLGMRASGLGVALLAQHLPVALAPLGGSLENYLPIIVFSILVFVRPALSLGFEPPLGVALGALWKKPLAVVFWVTLLSVPLAIVQFLLSLLVGLIWRQPPDAAIFFVEVVEALFNVVNFSAFEMATAGMLINLQSKWMAVEEVD